MKILIAAALVIGLTSAARAQQPFPTDDAEVTPKGKAHVEAFDEYDWLDAGQAPHQRQNTINMKVNYGLGRGLELDLDTPLITIVNDPSVTPQLPFGLGDTNLGVKYKLREERPGGPALAVVAYLETPTGDSATDLGSGLVDVWVYGVVQKALGRDIVARANGGYLFTGNTSTGVVGITTARGHVATFGGSLVKKIGEGTLGFDVTAAATGNADLERAQLQAMVGGNFPVRGGLTIDVGVIAGHFAASPRFGVQVGFSWDINQR